MRTTTKQDSGFFSAVDSWLKELMEGQIKAMMNRIQG